MVLKCCSMYFYPCIFNILTGILTFVFLNLFQFSNVKSGLQFKHYFTSLFKLMSLLLPVDFIAEFNNPCIQRLFRYFCNLWTQMLPVLNCFWKSKTLWGDDPFLTLPYFCSPSGCTFWGKKPWSRKKKILWQVGMLVGAPVGITLIAGIAVPVMMVGVPIYVGRKVRRASNKVISESFRFARLSWHTLLSLYRVLGMQYAFHYWLKTVKLGRRYKCLSCIYFYSW